MAMGIVTLAMRFKETMSKHPIPAPLKMVDYIKKYEREKFARV